MALSLLRRRRPAQSPSPSEVAGLTTSQLSGVADAAQTALDRQSKTLMATPPPDISGQVSQAERRGAAKRISPAGQVDPVTGKPFIGRAGGTTDVPGHVTLTPSPVARETTVPAATAQGVLRRRNDALNPQIGAAQIVKADPGILTEGLQGGASGAGLAHLFPKTAALRDQSGAPQLASTEARRSFDSPLIRNRRANEAKATAKAGILRQRQQAPLALERIRQEGAAKIAGIEQAGKPPTIDVSKERTVNKTPLASETSENTRVFKDGQEINPSTQQPFTPEELQAEDVDFAVQNFKAVMDEVSPGRFSAGDFKGSDSEAQSQIAEAQEAVFKALQVTPAERKTIMKRLETETMEDILASVAP